MRDLGICVAFLARRVSWNVTINDVASRRLVNVASQGWVRFVFLAAALVLVSSLLLLARPSRAEDLTILRVQGGNSYALSGGQRIRLVLVDQQEVLCVTESVTESSVTVWTLDGTRTIPAEEILRILTFGPSRGKEEDSAWLTEKTRSAPESVPEPDPPSEVASVESVESEGGVVLQLYVTNTFLRRLCLGLG